MHQGSVLQDGVHQLYKKSDWGGADVRMDLLQPE